MGITTAILATAGVAGGIALKSKEDHERRKRERKLREEKERNEQLMLGIKRERDSLEKKQIEQEMLAQLEAEKKKNSFNSMVKRMMEYAKLHKEEIIRKENERILEENIQRSIRDYEGWNKKKKEIISYFLSSVNYTYEISKYFESYNVDYTYYINNFISFLRNSDFYKGNINIIVNSYLTQINKEVLETKKQNYIVIGKTGAGKSCLINYLLSLKGDKKAKEGETLDPETNTIQRYENKSDNFTLTDTIGIEATNEERSLEKIEEMIKQHFDENTKNFENNIHGIIYCIKSDSTRVEQKERDLIKRLMNIYPKKGIKFIISITYHINKQNKRIYNFLKKEFGDSISIFEVNSKKESTDFGVVKESGRDKIIDFINTNSNDANSAVMLNYKSNKIKEMYERDFKQCKLILYTDLNNMLFSLFPNHIMVPDYSNAAFLKELNELSNNIRNSFHNNFIQNLIDNLSSKLSLERYNFNYCTIQENCYELAESEIKYKFINAGYQEAYSFVFNNFYKNLINPLFNTILEDLGNYKF